MPSTKELKQRIKGIKGTGKITRAMEMISAVKMRKAVARAVAMRPYAEGALAVLAQASQAMKGNAHTIFEGREVKKALIIVITSHRGLCGSFNANVMRQVKTTLAHMRDRHPLLEKVDFVSLGKKGDTLLRRFDASSLIASFPDAVVSIRNESVRVIARLVQNEYESGHYDTVTMISTDFISPLVQTTNMCQLLPLSQSALAKESEKSQSIVGDTNTGALYILEPSPERVLQALIPHLLETQIHHALLESDAAQEAARMMAMRNATDAAKDMVADFTLSYNQVRQAKVTQEIAELSAGMAAVSG